MDTRRVCGFASRSTLLVLVAALAAGMGLFAAQKYFQPRVSAPAPALAAVRGIDPPRVLPDFKLQRADGSALTAASLRGHWTIVFMGFTHCPDLCPTTLAELAKAQRSWRSIAAASRPQVLFVSVDPERDTPQKTAEYARYFSGDTIAAGGTPVAVASFAHALGLVYMKVPLGNGDYTMDHSATLVVLDAQGRQAGLIRPPFQAGPIAADLARLSQQP